MADVFDNLLDKTDGNASKDMIDPMEVKALVDFCSRFDDGLYVRVEDDFDRWNLEQKILYAKKRPMFYVYEKEIRYAKLGHNLGAEQNGKLDYKRPILVIKKVGSLFCFLPLTSKGKDNNRYYHRVSSVRFPNVVSSHVILSQMRTLDKSRLIECIGKISHNEFVAIQKLLKDLYLPEVA